MKVKIKKGYIGAQIAVIIFSLYAFSQLAWGNLIPTYLWLVLLTFALGLLFLNSYKSIKIDSIIILSMTMLVISIVWNNYEIAKYGIGIEIYIVMIFIFFWLAYNNNRWHSAFLTMMRLCGVFYTVFTYICIIFPKFYTKNIYPIFSFLGYDFDNKAGFTSNYGTNGLFMCTGICAFTAVLLFNTEHKVKKIDFVWLLFLLVGMLICGKRGQTIAVLFSIFVCYYFYNCNKKKGRFMKLILVLIISIIAIYIISLFFPEVLTIVMRFQEQSVKGDISTGRFTMWKSAYALFLQKPWIGHGWRSFKFTIYSIDNYDVHNVFLQLLEEVGIIGSIPFYIFILINFIKAVQLMIKIRKTDEKCVYTKYISVSVIYETFFICMCATGTAYYQIEYLFTYFMCCALIHYYSKQKEYDDKN